QVQALETQVRTFDDFRGTFNVSDYRWFNLRDGNSLSPNFQTQYGLMTDAYAQKPAFARYRSLVAALSVRPTPHRRARHHHRHRPRHRLKLTVRCLRTGRWLVRARGRTKGVRRVDFFVDGHRRARDRRPPFRRRLRSPRRGRHTVAAKVVTTKRVRYRLKRRLCACKRAAT